MIIALLIFILIRPFICSPVFPHSNFVYTVLLSGFLIAWACCKGLPRTFNKTTASALTVFLVVLLISLLISSDKLLAMDKVAQYLNGIFLFLICHSLSEKDSNKIITGLTATGVVISLLAVYQYFFVFPAAIQQLVTTSADSSEIAFWEQKRVFFPFYTPNCLAGYLIMIIPLALTFRARVPLFLILFTALLMTGSISALGSLALVQLIYMLSLRRRPSLKETLLLLATLTLALLVFLVRTSALNELFHPLFSFRMRLAYWQATWQVIQAHPWVGTGLKNLNLLNSYYSHQVFLQIWAELGIFAVASFLVMTVSILSAGFSALKNNANNIKAAGLLYAACAFLFHNLFDFSFFQPEVSLIWCVILGLLSNQSICQQTAHTPAS